MKHSTKPPTKLEAARMRRLKELPCVACESTWILQKSPTEIHHLLSGNKRKGHMFTIPLCGWHHRGIAEGDGPSLAHGSKPFHAAFGSDSDLLDATNRMLNAGYV